MSGALPPTHTRKRPAPAPSSVGVPPEPPTFPSAGSRSLQIEVVLGKIAGKLPPNALHTLRATCFIWNRGFVTELRHRRHCSVELKNEYKSRDSGGSCPMSEFTDLHRTKRAASDITFTAYSLLGIAANPKGALDFFNECGGSVRALTLDAAPRGDYIPLGSIGGIRYETLRAELWDMVPELEELQIYPRALEKAIWSCRHKFRICRPIPNLKKLTLSGFDAETAHPNHQALLNELIRVAVGLEALLIKKLRNFSVGAALRDYSTNLPNLRTLELDHLSFDAVDMRILIGLSGQSQNALRLEEFRCRAVFVNANPELGPLLHDFLDAQAPTLRELEVLTIGLPRVQILPVRIPQLPVLRTLRLLKAGETEVPVRFDSGSLAGNFPQLRKLQLLDTTPPKAEVETYILWRDVLQVSSHESVTHLGLGGFNMGRLRLLEVVDLYRLEFPAVTRLDLEVTSTWTPEEVISLWTTWPAMEALHITFRRGEERFAWAGGTLFRLAPEWELNEFLTGVPASSFPEVRRQLGARPASAPGLTIERIRHLLGKYKTSAGISDLKHLREFDLTICYSDATLTDIGGYLGLGVASRTLQHIVVSKDAPFQSDGAPAACQMSPRCVAFICEAFGPLAVIDMDV